VCSIRSVVCVVDLNELLLQKKELMSEIYLVSCGSGDFTRW
jgi:hypothetical protein